MTNTALNTLKKLGHSFRLISKKEYKDFGIRFWKHKNVYPKYYQCTECALIVYICGDNDYLISSRSPIKVSGSCKECVIRDIIE